MNNEQNTESKEVLQGIYDNVEQGVKKAERAMRMGYSPKRAMDLQTRKDALKRIEHYNTRETN